MADTRLQDLIDPEVMAGMIAAKIPANLVVSPFANVDTTLQGRPGSTITIPRWRYFGDAEVVGEGEEIVPDRLVSDSIAYQVLKAAKAGTLTDEAVLSGYGNPVGELNSQLAKAIAGKVDSDALSALLEASQTADDLGVIGYRGLVSAIDAFEEEFNSSKVIFVNPRQVTTLRLDEDFLSADKYQAGVAIRGEIGQIANTRIVVSKKIEAVDGVYTNPIVKLNADADTEDSLSALTIFLKRQPTVETERESLRRVTHVSIDQHYAAALTDDTKVVLAQFDADGEDAEGN